APPTPKKSKKKKKGKGKGASEDSEPTAEPSSITDPIEPSLEPVVEPARDSTQPTMKPEPITEEQDKAITGDIPATEAPAEPQQVSFDKSSEPIKEPNNVVEPAKSATETGSRLEASADPPSAETAPGDSTDAAPEAPAPFLDADRQARGEAQPAVLEDNQPPHVLDRNLSAEAETTLTPTEAVTGASSVPEPVVPEAEVVPAVERAVEPSAQPQETDDMAGLSKKEKKRRRKAAKDLAAKLAESQPMTSDTLT
ncbi:hypothetical protein F53441_14418, partial [Fusarium austroafricanum]